MKKIVLVTSILCTFSASSMAEVDCLGVSSPGNTYSCGKGDGNCTWWAAHKRPDLNFFPTNGRDAKNWVSLADQNHLPVYKSPKSGTVAVFSGFSNNDSGHVAYIESINSDGSFSVTEQDYYGSYGHGTVSAKYYPSGSGYKRHNGSYLGSTVMSPLGFIGKKKCTYFGKSIKTGESVGVLCWDNGTSGGHAFCEDGGNFMNYLRGPNGLDVTHLSNTQGRSYCDQKEFGAFPLAGETDLGAYMRDGTITGDGIGSGGLPPVSGPRVDLTPDFDIYDNNNVEVSASGSNTSIKDVAAGQPVRLVLEAQVHNADVSDHLRDDDSDSIDGKIYYKVEGVHTDWQFYVREKFDVDDLDKNDSPDEEEWFNIPNYPGKVIALRATIDSSDEVNEQSEANNVSRIERLQIVSHTPLQNQYNTSPCMQAGYSKALCAALWFIL